MKVKSRRKLRKLESRYREHPRLVPILAAVLIGAIGVLLLITLRDSAIKLGRAEANIVILHADNEERIIPTREETVGGLLENSGIELGEGDVVEPSTDTPIEEDNFRINVYRGKPVLVLDGKKKLFSFSAATTPRSIVAQVGLEVYPEDIVKEEPSKDFLREGVGSKVTVTRSTPANLNLYGSPISLRTHAKTVAELLAEKNVQLKEGDEVKPALNTRLKPNTQVFVTRMGTELITTEEEVPAPTETIEDRSLSFGTAVLRQRGVPGKKAVTYQIDKRNGVEIGRTLIQEVLIQKPVTEIIARGQAVTIPSDRESIMRAAGIASSDYKYVNYILSRENALWCPTRWQGQTHCPPYYEEKFPGAESHTSTGYGLCQATPANKMASAGSDWRTSAVTQLKWCHGYAIGRYGSWSAAYDFWSVNHWW